MVPSKFQQLKVTISPIWPNLAAEALAPAGAKLAGTKQAGRAGRLAGTKQAGQAGQDRQDRTDGTNNIPDRAQQTG